MAYYESRTSYFSAGKIHYQRQFSGKGGHAVLIERLPCLVFSISPARKLRKPWDFGSFHRFRSFGAAKMANTTNPFYILNHRFSNVEALAFDSLQQHVRIDRFHHLVLWSFFFQSTEAVMRFFASFDSHFCIFYLALLIISKPVAAVKRRNWKASLAFEPSLTFLCPSNASPGIVELLACHHR